MQSTTHYIDSGIIQEYVLGLCSDEDRSEVERLAQIYPEIHSAIDAFSDALEQYSNQNEVEPPPTVKPLLMATIDFMSRMEKGEQPLAVPLLNPKSTIEDFSYWINRSDMVLPKDEPSVFAKIIAASPEATTAIVWLKEAAPAEIHDDTYESFLVVEGSCTISFEGVDHALTPGDFITIPLYVSHLVKVTSPVHCKIILQRVGA